MKRTIVFAAALATVLAVAPSAADARPKHHRHHAKHARAAAPPCFLFFCPASTAARPNQTARKSRSAARASTGERRVATSSYPRQVLPHPPGCPRRLFCGCGASLRTFGRSIRRLWLADNWLGFPRAAPAPRMAAVRGGRPGRGHVFILEAHVDGDLWRVYDANAGGGRTLIHVRSIRGYRIVNPLGSFASRGQSS